MSQSELPTLLPIIDKYLKARLLDILGEDENRYRYLGETVNSLSDKIQNDYSLIIPFSLVAFQAHSSITEPEVILVYAVLKEYWKLIDIIYPELPIEIIKPIMLETISRLCDSNERIASIIYHANVSAAIHYKYDLTEGLLIKEVLINAAEKSEKFAIGCYNRSAKIGNKSNFSISIALPEIVEVDSESLKINLINAVSQTIGSPYNQTFGETVSKSIAQSIEKALSEFSIEASSVISEKLHEILNYIDNYQESNLETETKVLWWMQSLYSSELQSSYRDLQLPATIVAMTYDLLNIVHVPIPESVVYVLGEAILNAISDIPAKNRKAIELSEWLDNLKKSDVLNAIKPLQISSSNLGSHTQSLIAVVRAVLNGQTASKEMLGDLLDDVALTPRQLGMWLFRDLIAEKLVEEQDRG
jgi:hypothetical protein